MNSKNRLRVVLILYSTMLARALTVKLGETYRVVEASPTRSQRVLYKLINVLGYKGVGEALLESFAQLHSGLFSQSSKAWHGRIWVIVR